jgi:glycosyltransferase involved in cell wall biosynthesis
MTSAPRLSIVVPVLNERHALPGLVDEIEASCKPLGYGWEAIVVDDGSTDDSFAVIERLGVDRPWLRGIRLRSNLGKSAALSTGFAHAAGDLVVTIDGDGQDDPADIPRLIDRLGADADLVSGWKRDRRDPVTRRLASRFFNLVTSRSSGLEMHDMNCGLKAYLGECARSLEVYGELHRYLPVLAAQQGWRVAELPVNHRPRQHGRSRFGTERYLRGALDLLTVTFIGRYQHRPLHLFGAVGLAVTLVGLLISLYLTILKISGEPIGQRPLLFLGVLLIVVGIQLLSFGLLGQMLVQIRRERQGPPTGPAQIERTAGFDATLGAADGSSRSATETSAPA